MISNTAYTPLELLNLYYSGGLSTGNKEERLWQKMNTLLSWDNLLNQSYQSDLCPLLYYIIACRPMGDLDILIRDADKAKCCEILLKDGYEEVAESQRTRMLHQSLCKEWMGILIKVEIHHSLAKEVFLTN